MSGSGPFLGSPVFSGSPVTTAALHGADPADYLEYPGEATLNEVIEQLESNGDSFADYLKGLQWSVRASANAAHKARRSVRSLTLALIGATLAAAVLAAAVPLANSDWFAISAAILSATAAAMAAWSRASNSSDIGRSNLALAIQLDLELTHFVHFAGPYRVSIDQRPLTQSDARRTPPLDEQEEEGEQDRRGPKAVRDRPLLVERCEELRGQILLQAKVFPETS